MNKGHTWEQSHAMKEEWESWQFLFGEMLKAFNLTREELNKKKYKGVFDAIYVWAEFETVREDLLGKREYKSALPFPK
ncbi:MAG: hypothetical protein IIA87_03640 [Nanoarchaeota archaeon]|nr:hypothetical protein [Nanoarchaeota archaeon]